MKKKKKPNLKKIQKKEWDKEYKKTWDVVRKIVRERAGGICEWCGTTNSYQYDCDHIITRSCNILHFDLNNIIFLCHSCHFYKKKQHPVQYTRIVERRRGERTLRDLEEIYHKSKHGYDPEPKIWELIEIRERLEHDYGRN